MREGRPEVIREKRWKHVSADDKRGESETTVLMRCVKGGKSAGQEVEKTHQSHQEKQERHVAMNSD